MKHGSNQYLAMVMRWGYLTSLLLGYGLAGWLLFAFQVSWWIWCLTFALALCLIASGPAAITLSCGLVTGMISVVAVARAWVPEWCGCLADTNAELWAQGLLLVWFGAIGLAVLSAYTVQWVMRPLGLGDRRAAGSLVVLLWIAIATGGLSY
jgi:hypothetical protein